ncbi:DNA polymerase III, chi subunit [Rhodoferax sp. OV413]|uniref:DNA polymerase III subunit chi n=1 Tax=Rhodoferax sp. OV413 TaxID=1855285 RepID=UPI00088EDE2E|nr:DNA polymerase III subunit chi [Rhodoferax sp. OV413]SDP79514.1 DNA polymerase III, chi subunit [Rhodoferax sp. OV413]
MTEVAFHFNAPDKISYACRLLRKATRQGARVVVTGAADMLQQLDAALWSFSATDFVAHSLATDDATVLAASPVLLLESVLEAPHQQVLLQLGDAVPAGFERFERLIEVVTLDEDDRALARQRWKHYASRGYAVQRKDLELKEPS